MEIGTTPTKLPRKFTLVMAILSGIVFAGTLACMDYIIKGELASIYKYTFQGIFFGLVMAFGLPLFTRKFGNKYASKPGKDIVPQLNQDENIDIQGPANIFRGMEAVGGKLFLTNQKIIFKSHKINIQRGQTDIKYSDIAKIEKRKTAKWLDNGIRISIHDDKKYDFVVNERDLWYDKLMERIR